MTSFDIYKLNFLICMCIGLTVFCFFSHCPVLSVLQTLPDIHITFSPMSVILADFLQMISNIVFALVIFFAFFLALPTLSAIVLDVSVCGYLVVRRILQLGSKALPITNKQHQKTC